MRQLFLLGDSTCAEKEADKRPETGWGMGMQALVGTSFTVVNLALNGRSTKSFIQEGVFEKCLRALNADDVVMIQFGHNDSKEDEERHTDPWTTYQGNLAFMAEQVRQKGAYPILLTPICRRRFSVDGVLVQTHGDYPSAMRALAKGRGYAVFDLTQETFQILTHLGAEASKQLFLHLKPLEHPNYPEGVADDTHLNEVGARVVARRVFRFLSQHSPRE
ncbi:Rhamnogalacturonan acetylesterase RhgT [bioreactor metagenome]|jgi:lysophospholipase L1-like esterase|uniref:Rhamnogalacturonan acetylesterase RhgT n=1 Tax=bioreactor metagenome TaxID=1076179 RepID=A0A644XUN9_9ZZZZ|nr:rhamnogalacturonan acetylesterase [Sphaerochaeta sp.]